MSNDNGTRSVARVLQHLLQQLDGTDLSWQHGATEASLKYMLFTMLSLSLPAGVTVQSERPVGDAQHKFADLVLTDEKAKRVTVLELKFVPIEFVGTTRYRAKLTSRDELRSMKEWIEGVNEDKLKISVSSAKTIITPQQHLDDAFAQCVEYATCILSEENHASKPPAVIAIAIVVIGSRVLTRAGRVQFRQ